ncbi:hypothetical protein D9613_005785 [Agrocybe pediades]|uniref:Uncharacterized protein n=1 Tax=Agrocybe pediades TaxID=84607 RepID=A0A8H4QTX5_9AGAR|nr:hypothetical protein D9613_005785 [Agrocybe pediades]
MIQYFSSSTMSSPQKCVLINADANIVSAALQKAKLRKLQSKAYAAAHHAAICSASASQCARLANDIQSISDTSTSTNPHITREQRLGQYHVHPPVEQPAWDTVHNNQIVAHQAIYSDDNTGIVTPSGKELRFEDLVALPCTDANMGMDLAYIVYDG